MRKRALIDQAAGRLAEGAPLDQTYFSLDAPGFAAFQALLDKPPTPTDRLRRALKSQAPWDGPATKVNPTGRRVT